MVPWIKRLFFLLCLFPIVLGQISSPGALSSYQAGGQYIMLTFNEVLSSPETSKLLDVLKEKNAKATFFVCGSQASQHTGLLTRMRAEGHDIGNSGWQHTPFTKLNRDRLVSSILQSAEALAGAFGRMPMLVRPPLGLTNAQINQHIKKQTNSTVVLWSLGGKDEAGWQQLASAASPGDIILMHGSSFAGSIESVGPLVDRLHEDGFELLTVSEMLSFPDDKPH